MTAAAPVALLAIALLACGTPRQAQALFGDRLREPHRRGLRIAGIALLVVSLVLALAGGDRARHLVGWIGTIGIEALVVALFATLRTSRSRRGNRLKDRVNDRSGRERPAAGAAT